MVIKKLNREQITEEKHVQMVLNERNILRAIVDGGLGSDFIV